MTRRLRESPDEADLYVRGELVSTGEVVLYPAEGQGVFLPHDGKRLESTYLEASLNVAGAEDIIQIKMFINVIVVHCVGNFSLCEQLGLSGTYIHPSNLMA